MKAKRIRVPDSNELWRNSNSEYYYVVKNGGLYRLSLKIDSSDVCELLKGIKNICISESESCDRDILDGVNFWKFVAEDWIEHIKTMIHKRIGELNIIIGECVCCLGEI